jgi:alpha-tubulin suppressor-like RCC1 family protein
MHLKKNNLASGLFTLAIASYIYKKNESKFFSKKSFCFNDLNENFKKRILNKETDFYVWGKGHVENTSIYTNFHPHRIKNFNSVEKILPKNIIDITFNEHLAACIDKNFNLFVWREQRLNSEKNKEINNHERNNVIRLAPNIKVVNITFTKDKLFLLDKNGNVYFYNIKITQPERDEFFASALAEPEVEVDKTMIHVKELKKITMIATGKDHFIALDKDGKIYGMGDDSFGQLGLGTFTEQREQYMKLYSNFVERRERLPKLIEIPEKVKKIVCGENHTLVLSEYGNVYAFGYNRYLQLSNDNLYRQGVIGINKPTLIASDKFKTMKVIDIAASKNCSFFICKNEIDGTFYFFSAGEGLRGQLGQNLIKHLSDVEEMPDISGLVNSDTLRPFEPLKIKCGLNHCLLMFKNPRVIYVWGNNEFGELGTKDRVFYESPIPMLEEYTLPFNILNFGVGGTNSAFICEKVDPEKKKKILAEDLRMYEEEIKAKKPKKKRTKKEKADENKEEEQSQWKNKIYQFLNNLKKYI